MRDTGAAAQTDLPFARGSETSQIQAEIVEESGVVEAQIERVLAAIAAAGITGITDKEIQRRTGLPGDSERPRRWHLSHQTKQVEPAGKKPVRGKHGIQWETLWRLASLQAR